MCGRCQRVGIDCSLAEQDSYLLFIPVKNAETEKNQSHATLSDDITGSCNPSNRTLVESPEYLQSMMSPPSQPASLLDFHFTDTERERLRLMSHYTLKTANSIAEITIPKHLDQSLWSTWFTELALESDFLLHALLSLSALHLARCGVSSEKNIVMAIHHHDLGVALFRPHLSNITADYDAVIAFSCAVAFYAFGIQRCLEPEVSPIAKLHQVLTLIRGSGVIIKADYAAVLQSRWAVMLAPVPHEASPEIPNDMEDMLSTLQRRASTIMTTAADERNLYTSSIQVLGDSLAFALTNLFTQKTMTMFPMHCPVEFWSRVSAGEPLALAIFANYAVILHWQRENVWMLGWGKEVVDAVRHSIPLKWHECIEWAVRETEGG